MPVHFGDAVLLAGQDRAVASLEERARASMPQVETDRVTAEHPLRGLLQIGLPSLHLQMEMILHQTTRRRQHRVALG
jgi:hypothetical protein